MPPARLRFGQCDRPSILERLKLLGRKFERLASMAGVHVLLDKLPKLSAIGSKAHRSCTCLEDAPGRHRAVASYR